MTAITITNEELASILAEIRRDQTITWTDTDLDTRLTGIIKRGIEYINDCAGDECDYMVEGQARSLLFDYARYSRSGRLKDFWEDYKEELAALRAAMEVTKYVESLSDV